MGAEMSRMSFSQAVTLVSVAIAALSALLSLVSARASLRSVEAFRDDVALSRNVARVELARSFETDYASQYDAIWDALGPWRDPVTVDPKKRRVVGTILVSLAGIFQAYRSGLIDEQHARYVGRLFADWLALPEARHIWNAVFAVQQETWPDGFVAYVNGLIASDAPVER